MAIQAWGEKRQYNSSTPRSCLADVLPLAAPFLVHIDPTNLCNFRCEFCPTGIPELLKAVGRPAGNMKFELFEKIIHQLGEFPVRPKVLHLYKDGEPLLNPDFGRMAKLARTNNSAEMINVTTNAAPLSPRKVTEILDAEIDIVRVSVEHVTDMGYRAVTKTFGRYKTIVDNVARLYEEKMRRGSKTQVWVKILKLNLTDEDISKFESDFKDHSDECLVMTPMGWSRTDMYDFTLGSNPATGDNGETPLKTNRIVCPYPFYSMAINFDGSVSVCCADWSHATVVGDVSQERLIDIWNGPDLNYLRRMHLEDRRSCNTACAKCQTIQGLPQDSDLDDAREKIIKHYK